MKPAPHPMRFWLAAVSICALVATLAFGATQAHVGLAIHPPYRAGLGNSYDGRWGEYKIRINNGDVASGGLDVLSHNGKQLRRITDFGLVQTLDSVRLGNANVLHVHTVNNNEFQNQRDILFEQTNTGLRTDLVISGVEASPILQTYNGRPLLLSPYSAIFEWCADFSHGGSPRNLPVVLAWNGWRYGIATKRFPHFSRLAAREDQYRLIKCIHVSDLGENGQHTWIAGYYGNMVELGEGAFAYRWLMRHVPDSTKPWFREYAPAFKRKVIHSASVTASAPQSRTLRFDEIDSAATAAGGV